MAQKRAGLLRAGTKSEQPKNTGKNTAKNTQKHVPGRPQAVTLTDAQREQLLALYSASPLSLRQIGDKFGISKTRVEREARRAGVQRGNADEIAARVDMEGAKRIAEAQAGRSLVSPETIQNAFVVATAQVLERQRTDQRAARAAVQTVLARVQEQMAMRPALTGVIETLAKAAISRDDRDAWKAAMEALVSLEVDSMARTARQLVASLRDLDGLERTAYGLKDVTQGDANKGKARAVVVPAKAPLPDDDD